MGNMHKNFGKIGHVILETCWRRDRHVHHKLQYFVPPLQGRNDLVTLTGLIELGFGMMAFGGFISPIYCYKEILVPPKIRVLPLELCIKLWTWKILLFPSQQVHNFVNETSWRWSLLNTPTTVDVSRLFRVYSTFVISSSIMPQLHYFRFVVDLLDNLFLRWERNPSVKRKVAGSQTVVLPTLYPVPTFLLQVYQVKSHMNYKFSFIKSSNLIRESPLWHYYALTSAQLL